MCLKRGRVVSARGGPETWNRMLHRICLPLVANEMLAHSGRSRELKSPKETI